MISNEEFKNRIHDALAALRNPEMVEVATYIDQKCSTQRFNDCKECLLCDFTDCITICSYILGVDQ